MTPAFAVSVPQENRFRNEIDRVAEVAGIIAGCPAGDRRAQSVVATPRLM